MRTLKEETLRAKISRAISDYNRSWEKAKRAHNQMLKAKRMEKRARQTLERHRRDVRRRRKQAIHCGESFETNGLLHVGG